MGKRQAKSEGPVISAVLLKSASFPKDAFLKKLAAKRIAGKTASDINRGDNHVFSFLIGDEFFTLALMPAPYPDLDGPISTSYLWPRHPPIETVKSHRAHLLITAMGGASDPVRRRLAVTAVTALAARQPGVMAVYWPEATLVHFPALFVEMAETYDSPEAPPIYLWVDLRVIGNEDQTVGLFTTGLTSLGHKEIEIPRIEMAPGELRDWVVGIIYYLLDKGPVLKHGDTIGMTADQRVRVRHCKSIFGHPGTVIRLEP